MAKKKRSKTAEFLKEIDSNCDTIISILGKLAIVSLSIKTIIDIWTK